MVKLYNKRYNIGRNVRDTEGNIFSIAEAHSGFVWLRGTRGMKQIGKGELKFYKDIK